MGSLYIFCCWKSRVLTINCDLAFKIVIVTVNCGFYNKIEENESTETELAISIMLAAVTPPKAPLAIFSLTVLCNCTIVRFSASETP